MTFSVDSIVMRENDGVPIMQYVKLQDKLSTFIIGIK